MVQRQAYKLPAAAALQTIGRPNQKLIYLFLHRNPQGPVKPPYPAGVILDIDSRDLRSAFCYFICSRAKLLRRAY